MYAVVAQRQKNDKRCRAVHDTHQDDKDYEVATREFDAVTLKGFSSYSVRPVIIANLKKQQKGIYI